EKKSEIGKFAIHTRWHGKTPRATHYGTLQIGDINISCAVLEDGRRVISENGISLHLGGKTGTSIKKKKKDLLEGRAPMPVFLSAIALKQFINCDLEAELLSPIYYSQGCVFYQGFTADLLPKICDVLLKARDAGVLTEQQLKRAQKADILMRGLA